VGTNGPRPIYITNLNRVSVPEIESCDPCHADLGVSLVRGQQLPTLYLCIRFEKRSFKRLRNIESVAKFRNWLTSPTPRPLRGQFTICEQELPPICQYVKFEERSFIRDEDMAHFPSKD